MGVNGSSPKPHRGKWGGRCRGTAPVHTAAQVRALRQRLRTLTHVIQEKEKQSTLSHSAGALWSGIWPYIHVLRLGVYTVDTVRTLTAKERHLSAPLLPSEPRGIWSLIHWRRALVTTIWIPTMCPALWSSLTRWTPGITRIPDGGKHLPCWVTPLCSCHSRHPHCFRLRATARLRRSRDQSQQPF